MYVEYYTEVVYYSWGKTIQYPSYSSITSNFESKQLLKELDNTILCVESQALTNGVGGDSLHHTDGEEDED